MEKTKLGPQTLLFPMPAVLVGARVNETANFMTAAWCGIAASAPPAVTVALRPMRFTLAGIQTTGTFSINVPSADMAKMVDYCGIYSGHKQDKSGMFQVDYGVLETAPMVGECPVSLECKVLHVLDLKSHRLIVGEIIECYVRSDCITGGQPDAAKINPLVYVTGSQQYCRLGEIVGRAFSIGKKD
jgi:flavin reductase (DIM6/NTAB) family NADH-FMN oxidoreductase RutF